MRDAPNVVRSKRGGNNRFVFKQDSCERLEIDVAFGLLKINRTIPAILARFYCFVIPIRSLHQPHGETRAAFAAPIDQIAQIGFRISQISLDDDPGMWPIFELPFGENLFEKFERRIFVRVTFHVEINEGAEFSGPAQNRSQFRREMRDCIGRIGRVHLRIERGNFDGKIYDREKLRVPSERIGPACCFSCESLQQIKTARRVFVGLRFADDGFSQKIDCEPDFLCATFTQHFHYVVWILSRNKLARHSGNVPAQDATAHPRSNARQTNTGMNKGREAVAQISKIFLEMLDDFARSAQRREHIDKAKQLRLELFIAHR